MFKDTFHFIGVESRFRENKFESIEGVALDDMPVADMYEQLNLDDGECLAMNRREIHVVQCTARMPYVCYKNQTESVNITSIPPSDTRTSTTKSDICEAAGYTYYNITDSCYKLHTEQKTWDGAANTCSAENGHLVVIEDKEEAELLGKLYRSYNHIGLRYYPHNGGWKSITGKPVKDIYNVWINYNDTPRTTSTMCAQHLGIWIYITDCGWLQQFICEM